MILPILYASDQTRIQSRSTTTGLMTGCILVEGMIHTADGVVAMLSSNATTMILRITTHPGGTALGVAMAVLRIVPEWFIRRVISNMTVIIRSSDDSIRHMCDEYGILLID